MLTWKASDTPARGQEHSLVPFVFTEAMFPSLPPGIAGLSFLYNVVLILNAQVLYKEDVSPGTAIGKTPEMMRVKQTQDHISSVNTPPRPHGLTAVSLPPPDHVL